MKKTNAIRLLEAKAINYRLLEYRYQEEDLSVEQIATGNDLPGEQIFKTLVVKGDKTGVVIAVIPGHRKLDFRKLAAASGNKKVTLIPVKDIRQLTGYLRGGCSPVGMKKDFSVIIDQAAQGWKSIFLNAGARGLLMEIAPADLFGITGGTISDIAG